MSVGAQLKRTLKTNSFYSYVYILHFLDPTFWGHLQQRFRKEDADVLRDVTDGWEYLKHKHFLSEPANVSFLLNTDGVSLFRSSNISLWPIWLAVNELRPHVR